MIGDSIVNPYLARDLRLTRRQWFGRGATGIGVAALATLLRQDGLAAGSDTAPLPGLPHWAPRARRVVVLWQGGAPASGSLP